MNKPRLFSASVAIVFVLCAADPAAGQSLGGLFKRIGEQMKQKTESAVSNRVTEAVTQPTRNASNRNGSDHRSEERKPGTSESGIAVASASVLDDSPAARDAAIARLRAGPRQPACPGDAGAMSRTYGSTCNSREFPAPAIVSAPKIAWQTKPGWWGAWSPFLVGDLMLTGSCNNETNAGLSALDMRTGKTIWRIADMCKVGNRRGSTGNVAFHELPSGEVLMIYPRENGEPVDYYVINVKAGRIVRSLKPAVNATIRGLGGSFTGVNQSKQDGISYLIGLSPTLDKVLWRNGGFRLAMRDDDPHYAPTFSPPAMANGILFQTARSKDQGDPPTRQLHAIDLRTGQTLWRHTDQPAAQRGNAGAWRSDDGNPMVAGDKVVIRVQGLLGAAGMGMGRTPDGDALRALDMHTGGATWTTKPVPGTSIVNRVVAGDTLVAEVDRGSVRELWGWRLADGALAWHRPVGKDTRLLASSGGAFYVSERIPSVRGGSDKDFQVQGLDGETGTLLWVTVIPGHDLDFDGGWGIEPDPRRRGSQGPAWRIGRDGAIYGVTLTGAFKLQ